MYGGAGPPETEREGDTMTEARATPTRPAGPDADPGASGAEAGDGTSAEGAVDALKALADPVRLRMVEMLARGGGELCVCHFEEAFELTQPTISHHLKRLREAGLVDSRQDGTWVHHRLCREGVADLATLLDGWARDAVADDPCC